MNDFVNQLKRYQCCMNEAEACREKFEELLQSILWEYHHIGKDITGISIDPNDSSVYVAYDYSCRGCHDCDSQSIPGWVINSVDPVAAAKKHVQERAISQQQAFVKSQKAELERMKARVAQMEKGLGN